MECDKIRVYHRVFNPKLETIQGVVADVDKMELGYILERIVEVNEFEDVAIFIIKNYPCAM